MCERTAIILHKGKHIRLYTQIQVQETYFHSVHTGTNVQYIHTVNVLTQCAHKDKCTPKKNTHAPNSKLTQRSHRGKYAHIKTRTYTHKNILNLHRAHRSTHNCHLVFERAAVISLTCKAIENGINDIVLYAISCLSLFFVYS